MAAKCKLTTMANTYMCIQVTYVHMCAKVELATTKTVVHMIVYSYTYTQAVGFAKIRKNQQSINMIALPPGIESRGIR